MSVKIKEDGRVIIRTTITLRPGRDDKLIAHFNPQPLNVAGTIREAMRSGIVIFEKADKKEEEKINLDIGIEI